MLDVDVSHLVEVVRNQAEHQDPSVFHINVDSKYDHEEEYFGENRELEEAVVAQEVNLAVDPLQLRREQLGTRCIFSVERVIHLVYVAVHPLLEGFAHYWQVRKHQVLITCQIRVDVARLMELQSLQVVHAAFQLGLVLHEVLVVGDEVLVLLEVLGFLLLVLRRHELNERLANAGRTYHLLIRHIVRSRPAEDGWAFILAFWATWRGSLLIDIFSDFVLHFLHLLLCVPDNQVKVLNSTVQRGFIFACKQIL